MAPPANHNRLLGFGWHTGHLLEVFTFKPTFPNVLTFLTKPIPPKCVPSEKGNILARRDARVRAAEISF